MEHDKWSFPIFFWFLDGLGVCKYAPTAQGQHYRLCFPLLWTMLAYWFEQRTCEKAEGGNTTTWIDMNQVWILCCGPGIAAIGRSSQSSFCPAATGVQCQPHPTARERWRGGGQALPRDWIPETKERLDIKNIWVGTNLGHIHWRCMIFSKWYGKSSEKNKLKIIGLDRSCSSCWMSFEWDRVAIQDTPFTFETSRKVLLIASALTFGKILHDHSSPDSKRKKWFKSSFYHPLDGVEIKVFPNSRVLPGTGRSWSWTRLCSGQGAAKSTDVRFRTWWTSRKDTNQNINQMKKKRIVVIQCTRKTNYYV